MQIFSVPNVFQYLNQFVLLPTMHKNFHFPHIFDNTQYCQTFQILLVRRLQNDGCSKLLLIFCFQCLFRVIRTWTVPMTSQVSAFWNSSATCRHPLPSPRCPRQMGVAGRPGCGQQCVGGMSCWAGGCLCATSCYFAGLQGHNKY